ncbi:MFS transporter [Mucisphaera calidilacus]|uniref:Major Facilitator Superfamily protein n=1 Tax=Mucisphaera calidilacus TaxID=2527982 RepID=A0A518C091_9BACT|nr:MFS transporter [Mucisphaera calidilacus]QDU72638.1 Major Facilitator Superfamily protein [Mucisphaera calidilacus]
MPDDNLAEQASVEVPPEVAVFEREGNLYDEQGRRVWRCGSLIYTRARLARLFSILFVGQFTFNLEFVAFPVLLPLLLHSKGMDAGQIGTLLAIIPLGALLVFPIIGTMSDRTQTRWGRRRPYDFLTTPIWYVGLLMLPFVDSFAAAIIPLALISFAGAGSNILNALYNDVVPPELMGRFVAGMRLIGGVGAIFFQAGVLRFFDDHPVAVFIGISTLAFIVEMGMLILVKEGKYPPPPARKTLMSAVTDYAKLGFGNRYIILLGFVIGATALGGPVMGSYFNIYVTSEDVGLGLSSEYLGNLLAIGTATSMLFLIPAGWLIDRSGPKLLWGAGCAVVGALQIGLLLAESQSMLVVVYVLFAAANGVLTATLLPMLFAYLPQDRFGQLLSANQIFCRILQIIGAQLSGWVILWASNDYRYAFVFGGIAYLCTPLFMWLISKTRYPYPGFPPSISPNGGRSPGR